MNLVKRYMHPVGRWTSGFPPRYLPTPPQINWRKWMTSKSLSKKIIIKNSGRHVKTCSCKRSENIKFTILINYWFLNCCLFCLFIQKATILWPFLERGTYEAYQTQFTAKIRCWVNYSVMYDDASTAKQNTVLQNLERRRCHQRGVVLYTRHLSRVQCNGEKRRKVLIRSAYSAIIGFKNKVMH